MKFSSAVAVFLVSAKAGIISAATCGGGNVGDGVCAGGLCCSQWGWCGTTPEHCAGNPPPSPTPPSNPPPSPTAPTSQEGDSRLIAYVANWDPCPTDAQVDAYSHIVLAFAVSYTYAEPKNQCNSQCNIDTTVPVCNNANNQALIDKWRGMGKKVIFSFGGAGMGGSWSGDSNNCWDYCFGKEDSLSSSLVNIVKNQKLDGVDIDYEYCYDIAGKQRGACGQRSSLYSDAKAQLFLNSMTSLLRTKLDALQSSNGYNRGRYLVTHAPMDSDLVPSNGFDSKYFNILRDRRADLDFLMPQFYNGVTRPGVDGFDGSGAGSMKASTIYSSIAKNLFNNEPSKVVFGHCIADCPGSNVNANQAVQIHRQIKAFNNGEFKCNGGGFFWVHTDDTGGAWSDAVSAEVSLTKGCSTSATTKAPSRKPITLSPTKRPVTNAPTRKPIVVTNQPTSSPVSGFTKMNEQGYCLDASNEWYSAFKSNPLPLSTSDANCLSWCAQNLHPLLVAVETYRSADSLTCYCDYSGGAVPNTIDLSDYNPAALSAVTYPGVGEVQSTDSTSGASCYRYDNFVVTNGPTRKPITLSPTKRPVTNAPTRKPITLSPTKRPVTNAPTRKPIAVTNQPTSSPVSGFTKMNEQGYCLDASNEFYSAFKSNPLPLSTSDANCLSWCAQNLHPLLVAVETYRSADSLTCYCDFSGDAVPNTIDLSDYNPAALSAVINLGVGKVQSTDSSSGASCYRYVNFEASSDPTRKPSKSPTTHPSNRPTLKTTTAPTSSTTCFPPAFKIKLESTTTEPIHMFDVKIYSPGNNLALMERATQSSTLKGLDKFAASSAIDGDINSFSHTSDNTPWWQVELASISPIEYVEIKNRFCGNVDDLTGCLCRLSGAKLSLLNEIGLVVAEQHLDDTCGKLTVDFRFNPTFPCSDPTPSPTPSATGSPAQSGCLPIAKKVKIQSISGEPLQMFEVKVLSSSSNVASGKSATQASNLKGDRNKFGAHKAVDGSENTFSHTEYGVCSWWEVDLEEAFAIESVNIVNRWCGDVTDPSKCLCRLSRAVISLEDENGNWVDTLLGDTCGELEVVHDYGSYEYCK